MPLVTCFASVSRTFLPVVGQKWLSLCCVLCESWSVTDSCVHLVCRGSLSPVWRWNQAAQDAERNYKCRHNPCSLRKCLSTAAHHENAGVAQYRHLHQRWKQKCLLWVKWCQVSSYVICSCACVYHLALTVGTDSLSLCVPVKKAHLLSWWAGLFYQGVKPLSGFLELIDKVWFTKVRTDFSHTDLCMLHLKGMGRNEPVCYLSKS